MKARCNGGGEGRWLVALEVVQLRRGPGRSSWGGSGEVRQLRSPPMWGLGRDRGIGVLEELDAGLPGPVGPYGTGARAYPQARRPDAESAKFSSVMRRQPTSSVTWYHFARFEQGPPLVLLGKKSNPGSPCRHLHKPVGLRPK